MAKQTINIGTSANDRSGDPLRTAFDKINQNFTELYTAIGTDEAAEFGNFQFVGNQLRNINGGSINNSDASHGSTAYINFPANGSGNTEILNYYGGLSVSTSSSGVGQLKTWTFGQTGTLTTPLMFPKSFTAVLDSDHMINAVGFDGDLWHFDVEFQVNPSGTIQTVITNNTPWPSNPGYQNDYEFQYTEADHNIPGYVFTLTLVDIQHPGSMMWTTNLAASIAPEYPSTLKSLNAVKITADTSSFLFGANGDLTLPPTGQILGGDLTIKGYSSVAIKVPNPLNPLATKDWGFDGIGRMSFPDGTIQSTAYNGLLKTVAPTPGTLSVGAATSITVTNSPNPNWTHGTGIFANGINFAVAVDGSGNATVSVINDGGTGHYVGETFGPVLGSAFGGTDGADDMYFSVSAVDADNFTALSLTKQVQKLGNGYYTLNDGQEGQIMYFVRTTGATGLIRIYVTNLSRTYGNEYTNNFIDFTTNDIITLLYTDGAWQAVGGLWD